MEIWKPIPNYEGLYEVSNTGKIKSLSKIVDFGSASRLQSEKIMRLEIMKKGYSRIALWSDGVGRRVMVHRIVFEVFNGPIPNGYFVNHKDLNNKNNNAWNLELVTNRENTHHYRKSIPRSLPIGVRSLRNKFQARFNKSNKVYYLGVYDTPEEASKVFQEALLKLA
jgi:hypothetical protein